MSYNSLIRMACLLLVGAVLPLGGVLPYGQAQYVHIGPPPPVIEHPYRAPAPPPGRGGGRAPTTHPTPG